MRPRRRTFVVQKLTSFFILCDLESMKGREGVFCVKLCYPELTEFPCNEWIQRSNPATESTITGYAAIRLTWNTD
jgi:hypothetical protein